jgi:hypothetical protein
MLVKVPMQAAVLDAGRLSPGRRIGELLYTNEPQEIEFSSAESGIRNIELLSSSGIPETGVILLDGNPVPWNSPLAGRPDVYTGAINLAGAHRLRFRHSQEAPPLLLRIRGSLFWVSV